MIENVDEKEKLVCDLKTEEAAEVEFEKTEKGRRRQRKVKQTIQRRPKRQENKDKDKCRLNGNNGVGSR